MPFIRGRYHINAVAGEAIEAAREAEAALLALQHGAEPAGDSRNDGNATNASYSKAPIHRVEIEAAETVPAHTGRAQRGFVARIHRAVISPDAAPGDEFASDTTSNSASVASRRPGTDNLARIASASGSTSPPETHVFAHHADLVNFLHNEFARDCPS
jgi:hypothetical protein